MNLQQLEYIIAIDTHRHFAKAAASCCVTQPTLSAMIQKLENELGIVIFDRSRQPVVSTEIGALVIQQARRILAESTRMKEIIQEARGEIKGELKIGIIPTVAPFLLPLFLNGLLNKYTGLNIKIIELTTDQIVDRLQKE
ncbi:MAG: LysR family transcriptional regulator, partial [Cyclobacteriaceae bacterium]